jgi:hypothetical protein
MQFPRRVCRVLPVIRHRHCRSPGHRHQRIVSFPCLESEVPTPPPPPLITRVSLADLTDAEIVRESLDSSLFPGISSSVEVHSGFANEQARYVTDPPLLASLRTPTKTSTALHRRFSPTSIRHSQCTARRPSPSSATLSALQSRSSTASTFLSSSRA